MPPEAHLQSDLSYVPLRSLSGGSVNVSACLPDGCLSKWRANGENIIIEMVCLEEASRIPASSKHKKFLSSDNL